MALKVVGFLSQETGKVYKTKGAVKAVATKVAKAEYNQKLAALQAKFNKR